MKCDVALTPAVREGTGLENQPGAYRDHPKALPRRELPNVIEVTEL